MKTKNFIILLLFTFILSGYFTSKKREPSVNQKEWRKITLHEKMTLRQNIVKAAKQYAQKKNIRIDCSGLILKIFKKNNVTIFKKQAVIPPGANGVKIIYATLKKYNKIFKTQQKAQLGDLIFFNNTYDKNKNKRFDDNLTHIAIIVDKKRNGLITYIHKSSKGIVYGYMNLRQKTKHKYNSKIINSYIRRKRRSDSRYTKHLAGELFISFGTIF